MSILVRFFVIVFAALLSILAAGFSLAIGVMLPDWVTVTTDPVEHFVFMAISFFATGLVGAYAVLPLTALIVIGEWLNIRSIFYYALGGALIGLLAYYSADIAIELEATTDLPPVAFGLQLVTAAGIVGGFVYWLIAGRKAGLWKAGLRG